MTTAVLRRDLLAIFAAALRAVNGARCTQHALAADAPVGPVHLLAVGKAACAMATGAQTALGETIVDGLVVTKYGHGAALPWPVLESGHPIPDAQSLTAGKAVVEFIAMVPPQDTILFLLSGGASSLIEQLPPAVSLGQLQALTNWLMGSGLDIESMNQLRKRVSLLKGGRMARLMAPRPVHCLMISDVPGDEPSSIASGPVVADAIADRPMAIDLPVEIQAMVAAPPPAPAIDDSCFATVRHKVIATRRDAMAAARLHAATLGYPVLLHDEFVAGDAVAVGAALAARLHAAAPNHVCVWSGETTVVLPDKPGRGGRNQNVALAAARALQGRHDSVILAAGTDGSDGPTGDAGAVVDGETLRRGQQAGLDADDCLARADAGTFLAASSDLIDTGPTGTNVMDLMLGLRGA